MNQTPKNPTNGDWARFRFSIVGSLFSSPPAPVNSKRPSALSQRRRGAIP